MLQGLDLDKTYVVADLGHGFLKSFAYTGGVWSHYEKPDPHRLQLINRYEYDEAVERLSGTGVGTVADGFAAVRSAKRGSEWRYYRWGKAVSFQDALTQPQGVARYTSDHMGVLAVIVSAMLRPEGGQYEFYCGFPPRDLPEKGRLIASIVGDHKGAWTVGTGPSDRLQERPVTFTAVNAFSEVNAAWASNALTREGQAAWGLPPVFEKNLLCFDIGFGTISVGAMVNGRIDTNVRDSLQIGTHTAYRSAATAIRKKFSQLLAGVAEIRGEMVERAIRDGVCPIANQNYEFSAEAREIRGVVFDSMVKAANTFAGGLASWNGLLFSGGGPAFFGYENIREAMARVGFVDPEGGSNDGVFFADRDPSRIQFANVNGIWNLMMLGKSKGYLK